MAIKLMGVFGADKVYLGSLKSLQFDLHIANT